MDNENSISSNETFLYYEDDFIDSPQMIKKLLDVKKSSNYSTNLTKPWPEHLIPEGVGEVKIWEVENHSIVSYLCYRIADIFPKVRTDNYTFKFQVTEWQPGSFIPFHEDGVWLCALTCYLDDKTEHGGEFLCKPFEDQTLGMFLEPKVNRIVFLKGVDHGVAKIHRGTRTTLQVWGEIKNADL